MSEYVTNGYLVSLLEKANGDISHPEHAEAQLYLTKFATLKEHSFGMSTRTLIWVWQ